MVFLHGTDRHKNIYQPYNVYYRVHSSVNSFAFWLAGHVKSVTDFVAERVVAQGVPRTGKQVYVAAPSVERHCFIFFRS